MPNQENIFQELEFLNSVPGDLPVIFELFSDAVEYQKRNGYELWPKFPEQLILQEIEEKRHWKILYRNKIVCIFSVLYSDPLIWGEKDSEPSVYLHRIAVNHEYKGRQLLKSIMKWSLIHAKQSGKKYVRMDTWGRNLNLRNYYINCGFRYIGQQLLEDEEAHYGGKELSLFELEADPMN